MLFILTIIILRELNNFSRRLTFHYYYFNLFHDGEDRGFQYLARRTVLINGKEILHEAEEKLLQGINE